MPFHKHANRLQHTDYRKKAVVGGRSTVSKPAFTLIELLVARHPKLQRRKATPGFTLIELLVVIAILGILSVYVISQMGDKTAKARDGVRKSDLGQIASALERYYFDNGLHYVAGNYTSVSGGDNWIPGLTPDIKKVPRDPKQAGLMNFLAGTSPSRAKNSSGQVAASQTIIRRPNGAGNRVDVTCFIAVAYSGVWQSQSPGGGEHWDKLDEDSADENTYIESNVDGQWDGYTHPASGIPEGSTISSVKICVRAMSLEPPPWDEEEPYWRIAAPAIISGNILYYDDFNIYESYSDVCRDWAINPDGNIAWTAAAVDTAQIAMRKSYDTHTRVTQAWMEVTFDPSTAPLPTEEPEPTMPPSGGESANCYYAYFSDPQGSYYELWAKLEDKWDPVTNTGNKAQCKLSVPVSLASDGFNYCMSSHD